MKPILQFPIGLISLTPGYSADIDLEPKRVYAQLVN